MTRPAESAPAADDPEPRWLSEDEQHAWSGLTGVIMRLNSAMDAQLRRDAQISHFEYAVMARLSESSGRRQRISDLAGATDASLPRLSQAITRLETRGWIQRTPDPLDGRYTFATLTDEGMDKVRQAAPGHVGEVRRIVFDPLTRAQIGQLAAITHRIMSAIDRTD